MLKFEKGVVVKVSASDLLCKAWVPADSDNFFGAGEFKGAEFVNESEYAQAVPTQWDWDIKTKSLIVKEHDASSEFGFHKAVRLPWRLGKLSELQNVKQIRICKVNANEYLTPDGVKTLDEFVATGCANGNLYSPWNKTLISVVKSPEEVGNSILDTAQSESEWEERKATVICKVCIDKLFPLCRNNVRSWQTINWEKFLKQFKHIYCFDTAGWSR